MDSKEFPVARRPLEYLAFAVFLIPTREGTGYFYFAIDAYNGFSINLGMDRNDNPETILKYIYLLTENSDITKKMDEEFTLVLEEHEELAERIRLIIKGVSGLLMIDSAYHNYITSPVLRNLGKYLEKEINKK